MSTEPKRKKPVGLIVFGSIIGLIACGIVARFALPVLGGLGGLRPPPEDWAAIGPVRGPPADNMPTILAERTAEAKLAPGITLTVEAKETVAAERTQEAMLWVTAQASAWISDDTPSPGDTITVTGQLLAGDGQPFTGAEVYCYILYSEHTRSRYPGRGTIITGSDGSATIVVTVPRDVALGSPATVNVYFDYKKSKRHSATTSFTPTSR